MSYLKEGSKAVGGGFGIVFLFLAIIAIIGGVIWGFGVVTSGIKGQGDAVRINNSAENWTGKQEKFEKLNAGVIAAKDLVALHKQNLIDDPQNLTVKQTLAGVRSNCITQVSQYNAESRKILSRDWKSPDLPYQHTIDGCK